MGKSDVIALEYESAATTSAHGYLLPALTQRLEIWRRKVGGNQLLFDLGCGNGAVAAHLNTRIKSCGGKSPVHQESNRLSPITPKLSLL